jgi:hypothetical protein
MPAREKENLKQRINNEVRHTPQAEKACVHRILPFMWLHRTFP